MNHQSFALIALIALLFSCAGKQGKPEHSHDSSQLEVQQDTIKKSIPQEVHAQVGDAHLMIKYHAPAVRGRTIWGGLVPLGEVWVTGAHHATSLETNKTLLIDGKEIPAGKYAVFTIPNVEKWTIILNKNWEQHLTDEYNQQDDIIRIAVTPEPLPSVQERLKYAVVSEDENHARIEISWEKIKVSLPLQIK